MAQTKLLGPFKIFRRGADIAQLFEILSAIPVEIWIIVVELDGRIEVMQGLLVGADIGK